jgi:hypothetical protein
MHSRLTWEIAKIVRQWLKKKRLLELMSRYEMQSQNLKSASSGNPHRLRSLCKSYGGATECTSSTVFRNYSFSRKLAISISRYLPPPVLVVLNNQSVEAAKRAAILTSALTWLLSNLPLASLPAALAPAALLLRALVPLLGAIGTFISWSWKAVVTFDKGNGVILSATWLLPIVLVPGTWEDDEMPAPPPDVSGGRVQSSTITSGPSRT